MSVFAELQRCLVAARALALLAATVLALPFLLFAAGCGQGGRDGAEKQLKVVASTTQVADFVRAVGGDRVFVSQIVPPNADPHNYEPRPSDAANLAESEVVFRSGGGLDDWLTDLIEQNVADGKIIDLSTQVVLRREGGEDDPHWWQNPKNAIAALEEIQVQLSKVDPSDRQTFERNADRYIARLKALDEKIANCFRQIPLKRRKMVTDHDAFGYFADRYGIKIVGTVLPSLSSQAQPSAKATKELIDQIKAEQVKAVFPESQVNLKLSKAIATQAGAKVGPPLYADTLGSQDSDGGTYLGSIADNARNIAAGITATPPKACKKI